MKIALLQIFPGRTVEEDHAKGEAWCRKAAREGADLALFPELWSCGGDLPGDARSCKQAAISYGGAFVRSFGQLARQLQMAIGITFLENCAMQPKNSFCLFDRNGWEVLHNSKVHTCGFAEDKCVTAGDDFSVCDLETAEGSVRVGALLGFDAEFSESARILMLEGAELVLAPQACAMGADRLALLRGYAYENMYAVASVNYPAGACRASNGHSSVYDGVSCFPGGGCPRETCLLQAGEEEGLFFANIDLPMLRAYRRCGTHGNTYRRPDLYGSLTRDITVPIVGDAERRR